MTIIQAYCFFWLIDWLIWLIDDWLIDWLIDWLMIDWFDWFSKYLLLCSTEKKKSNVKLLCTTWESKQWHIFQFAELLLYKKRNKMWGYIVFHLLKCTIYFNVLLKNYTVLGKIESLILSFILLTHYFPIWILWQVALTKCVLLKALYE